MAEGKREVVIAPSVYVNPDTQQKRSSTTYHYAGSPCVATILDPRTTDEATALLFGRTLCGSCASRETQAKALTEAMAALDPGALAAMADALGPQFELRVYWTPPGETTTGKPLSPKTLWRSGES